MDLFAIRKEDSPPPELPEFPFEKLFDDEESVLGVAVRCHPLERFRALLPEKYPILPNGKPNLAAAITDASMLHTRANKQTRLAGWLVTSRRFFTSKKNYMKFLSLEDETDIYEAILFDRAYQKYGHLTLTRGPYVVEGMVREEEGHFTLHVERVELLGVVPIISHT